MTMDSSEEETIYVDSANVYCDGGPGGLGHPGIFLNIGEQPQILCPYCSRRFAMNEGSQNAYAGGDGS